MNKKGFTLIEVLTVVLIIGVLASIAMPMYVRAVERSRATEAMAAIKALNDSIYAYFAEKDTCPTKFSQLVVNLPDISGISNTNSSVSTKMFQFSLGGADADVPGTDGCKGVLATRINGGGYSYKIWNPYSAPAGEKAMALQCAPTSQTDTKSIALCESLGLYRSTSSN